MASQLLTTWVILATLSGVVMCEKFDVSRSFGISGGNPLLNLTFTGAEKLLSFLASDYSQASVDLLLCLRIGQGPILNALSLCNANHQKCDDTLQSRLETINELANNIAEVSFPYVELSEPAFYVEKYMPLMTAPLVLPYTPATLGDMGTFTEVGPNSYFNIPLNDECMARMMGSFSEGKGYIPKCNFTQRCWDYNTEGDTSNYRLTHQILYFMVLEGFQCQDKIQAAGRLDLLRMTEMNMCRRVHAEVLTKISRGTGKEVTSGNRDLFMEQVMFCGILGFEDFLKDEWVLQVLRWQTPAGCYQLKPGVDDLAEYIQLITVQKIGEMQDSFGGRKLLHERPIKDGCMAHITGVAFTTLCTFIHHYTRQSLGL